MESQIIETLNIHFQAVIQKKVSGERMLTCFEDLVSPGKCIGTFVYWPARRGLNSVEWAVELQTNQNKKKRVY